MADVLSQSQIDALLNSMQNTDMEELHEDKKTAKPKYRKYDFYSPKKYTKDKLKMLHSIFFHNIFIIKLYILFVGCDRIYNRWIKIWVQRHLKL